MSFVSVHIPEDGWFLSGCGVIPQDKQLVIIIHKYGNQTPHIYQYRKSDWLYDKSDYFLDVSEKWVLDSYECGEEWNPGFATMDIISKWKPLALPPNDNERILLEIEKWFGGLKEGDQMSDLISRSALNELLDDLCVIDSLYDAINKLPTVDAVPVVRCKDCKHWGTGVIGETEYGKCCKYGKYMVGENGFCVYADKKGDENV